MEKKAKRHEQRPAVFPWSPERIDFYKKIINSANRAIIDLCAACGIHEGQVSDLWFQPRTHSDGTMCKDLWGFVSVRFYRRIDAADYAYFAEELGVFIRDRFHGDVWGEGTGKVSEVFYYKTPSRKRIKIRFLLKMAYD